ncbi:MAG: LPP20 family lipoprotein [Elusimicrobia bacterium]|nr:LPP20 family lipoprotein [Elusimicrobiota bacterium]
MTKDIAAALFLALAPMACAGSNPRSARDARSPKPDWVDGQSMEYPREQYLTGVGMGDDRTTAEGRARGEVSRVFSSAVTVMTTVHESEATSEKGGKPERSFSQEISQNVQTASKKILEDVSIAETWRDDAAARTYALAVLDRAKGANILREKISDFDKQIEQWKKSLDEADGRLPRVKAAMKLQALLKARGELNGELRVVDASGKGLNAPIDEAQVKPQAAKALAALNVNVDVEGSGSTQVETGIVQGLAGFGLEARKGKADGADILIEGISAAEQLEQGKGDWKWARSTATLTLKDAKTSKTFLQFEESDRQASANYEEAARRSLSSLAKKVSKRISEAITAYFENQ